VARPDRRADQLALLVDSVQDYAIFLLDTRGVVATWNRGAERIKGYRADEIIGRHFSTFYTEEAKAIDHPAYELEVAMEVGRFEEEGWRVRKDGSQFWANVVITTLYDADGNHAGFGKVTRDLTERRALQQDLMRSNAELERFASLAAHDLAEPLRTIGGFADLIARRYRDQMPQDAVTFLDQIKSGVGRMDALIQSLLGYARSGSREINESVVAVGSIADAVVDDLRALIEQYRADVRVDAPDSAAVVADQYGLSLVLQNLIVNAIKFGGPGEPQVNVTAQREDGAWRVAVRDHGVGISRADRDRVFEPFERGRPMGAPGNGLGLATCRRIIERHGGRIGVDAPPDGGSEFWFTLPAAAAE
jgi:PAS domain S-box-containing protein